METIDEILNRARWFYISYQTYSGFYLLIVENGEDDWSFYYLEYFGKRSRKRRSFKGFQDSGYFDDGNLKTSSPLPEPDYVQKPVPSDYSGIHKDTVFRKIERQYSKTENVERDISNCEVQRKVDGNWGAIITEFHEHVSAWFDRR